MYKDDLTVPVQAPVRRSWLIAAVAAIWLVSAVGGLWVLWIYENEPDVPAPTPVQQSASAEDLLAVNRSTPGFLADPQVSGFGGLETTR